jgi:hypothetical protein
MRKLVLFAFFSVIALAREKGPAKETVDHEGAPSQASSSSAGLRGETTDYAVISRTDFIDGTPVIYYKGKKCEHSKTQLSDSGPSVYITCYDRSFEPNRQCNFTWHSNPGTASMDIATYSHSEQPALRTTVLTNTEGAAKKESVSYSQVSKVAAEMLNKHCADPRTKFSTNKFEDVPSFTLKNGVECEFNRDSHYGAAAPTDLEIICIEFRGNRSLYCQIGAGTILDNRYLVAIGSLSASEVDKPRPMEASVSISQEEGNVEHHEDIVKETVDRKQFGSFHQSAQSWLEENCHWPRNMALEPKKKY